MMDLMQLFFSRTAVGQLHRDSQDENFFMDQTGAVCCFFFFQVEKEVGVSKNRGTPKWMVYNGKPY